MIVLTFVKNIAAAIWLAGFMAGSSSVAPGHLERQQTSTESDLSGKVLLVSVKGSPEWKCLLDGVSVKTLGDRALLVGKMADLGDGKNVLAGRIVWISAEQVGWMAEFKNLDEAKRACASSVQPDPRSGAAKQPVGAEQRNEMPSPDVTEISERSFWLPMGVDPAASHLEKVALYCSTDEGKTWRKVAEVSKDRRNIRFDAPADGAYWFAVQTIYKDGTRLPGTTAKLIVAQKVLVKSCAPSTTSDTSGRDPNEGSVPSRMMPAN